MGAEQSTRNIDAHRSRARPPPAQRGKGGAKGECASYRSAGKKRARDGEETFDQDALDESLDLLAENDYTNLARERARYIKGSLTWARLASGASNTIRLQLLSVRSDQALDVAVENARELMHRMETREGVNGARITKEIRERINLLAKVAVTLRDLRRIVSGDKATDDAAGRATMLKQRWNLLDGGENVWVRDLMTKAVAKVLASSAPGHVKSMFNRALQHWLPSPPASATASPSSGTQVTWDSDEDW